MSNMFPFPFQKLADMAEVLDAREKKLVELSRDNIDLVEAKSILQKYTDLVIII